MLEAALKMPMVEAVEIAPVPEWALLQRQIFAVLDKAAIEFADRSATDVIFLIVHLVRKRIAQQPFLPLVHGFGVIGTTKQQKARGHEGT